MRLQEQFGNIDIYLFDQILRGRIAPGMVIFDAGCGGGRNLIYLAREGYEIYAVDADARSRPPIPPENFRIELVEAHSFPDSFADVVISSAVLHFARNEEHFLAMLRGSWRALKPGGLFFCRLASTIGIEDQVHALGGRRFRLPDGSERFLVDGPMLMRLTSELGGELADPLKTTVVQNQRSMTTWVLWRR